MPSLRPISLISETENFPRAVLQMESGGLYPVANRNWLSPLPIASCGALVETAWRSFDRGLGRATFIAVHGTAKTTERKNAMLAFLKSDLFLRFLGGFAIGAIGVFVLQPNSAPPLTGTAMAASASSVDHAAR